ncbi:MAG TPA: HD domain-containing protein, partial [Longimicrobiales bacterium]|nr:HD domain-containing protein [Longimicrobiales bacterium]
MIRDPIYGPIPLDPVARRLIDTPAFQRLRRVQQLSLASLVYPSAMHTRFEHSVGVYHLARSLVETLERRGELQGVDPDDVRIIPYAGLLHDLSQHLAAHLLDEFGVEGVEHEEVGARTLSGGELGEILTDTGIPDVARRIGDIINQRSANPLAGIVAGNCDADKMDYIARDAYHCGLPIGFDQMHLRDALTLLPDPETGALRVGLDASGLTSFEQMLYSKSSLFRNVYFHRTVRSAMGMLRTLVLLALDRGVLDLEELHRWSDSELFTVLRLRVAEGGLTGDDRRLFTELLDRLLGRRLYRVACTFPLSSTAKPAADAILAVERELADALGLGEGQVVLDFPAKPSMLDTDLLVRFPDGAVRNASGLGPEDGFALNAAQEALY